jgi:hypothetical protein
MLGFPDQDYCECCGRICHAGWLRDHQGLCGGCVEKRQVKPEAGLTWEEADREWGHIGLAAPTTAAGPFMEGTGHDQR